ncbi:CmcI family methyltransferase [Flavisolibacter nicotianae]|uniref:CmcI family methyltransferase n=1 Tax=Flavisolibacter nicotianae TaxID=2364882 RepID=UPI0013C4E277|nr:CmcI family methyltransferase [Flavisolibacter nicotianae]
MSLLRRIIRQKEKLRVRGENFSLTGVYKGHYNITYKGVPCLKCPFDYVLYQMIIQEVKPDLIVEIGANHGGSAYYMADLLNAIGHGQIHSIDIADRVPDEVKKHPRIKFFFDGWEKYDLSQIKGERILVIEDASHHYDNTLAAINHFAPVVTKDSYLIVEDGIIDRLGLTENFNGGPVRAIKEFLPVHPEFVLDLKWHNFFGEGATFNTMGYLKRVK